MRQVELADLAGFVHLDTLDSPAEPPALDGLCVTFDNHVQYNHVLIDRRVHP